MHTVAPRAAGSARLIRFVVPPVLAVLALACDSQPVAPPGGARPEVTTFWKDIKPLVDARCASCHVAGGIGPFPLKTFADVDTYLPIIQAVVTSREMPPWLPGDESKPLRDSLALSEEDRALFLRWIDEGAVEGDSTDPGAERPASGSSLSRVDVTLAMTAPYTPVESPDEYRCFVLEWPFATTKYVTGHRIVPGNTSIVHHAIGFLIAPENVDKVRAFDAADAGPGYRCYGGPTADTAEQLPASFLASWSPGNEGLDRPEGTGIAARPGSLFVLQVHYNMAHATDPAPDLTKVELSLADEVSQRAYSIAWFNVSWYFEPELMDIPAGAESVVHSYEALPNVAPGVLALSDGETYQRGMWLHSALPHMHTFGRNVTVSVRRASGQRDVLLTIPGWNFHWQREYVWQEPQPVYPGDKLSIDCEWDNSEKAQPMIDGKHKAPRDLGWGEGSADEMCLALIYVTPM